MLRYVRQVEMRTTCRDLQMDLPRLGDWAIKVIDGTHQKEVTYLGGEGPGFTHRPMGSELNINMQE